MAQLTPQEQQELISLGGTVSTQPSIMPGQRLQPGQSLVSNILSSPSVQSQRPPIGQETIDNAIRSAKNVNNWISALPDIGALVGETYGLRQAAMQGLKTPGGPIPKAFGAAGTSIFYAMGGTAVGESVRQIFQNELDPLKAIYKIQESGLFAGLGEIATIFDTAGRGIQKLRTGQGYTAEDIKGLDLLVAELAKEGITITPAQLVRSGFQQTLEKIAVAGFGGEAKFGALYEAQEQFIRDQLDQLVKQTGDPSRKVTGEMFLSVLRQADDDLIKWATPKYEELERLSVGTPLDFTNIIEKSKQELSKGRRSGASKNAATTLDSEIETLHTFLNTRAKNNTFAGAFDVLKKLQADLREAQSRTSVSAKSPNQAYVKALTEAITDVKASIKTGAESSGNQKIQDLHKEVSEVYESVSKTLNDSALSGIAAQQPEFVGSQIYANGNVSSVEAAFKAIDKAVEIGKKAGKMEDELLDAESLKNDLRAGYLRKLFTPTEVADTSTETALTLLKKIERDPELSDTFQAVLTATQVAQTKRILGWAKNLDQQAAGNFSLIVRGRQSGAANQVINQMTNITGEGVKSTVIAAAASLIATPFFLANRAINGQVTTKLLEQLKDYSVKFNTGKMDAGDVGQYFGLLASVVKPNEELPPELKIPGLDSRESLELHRLQLETPQFRP